MIHELLEELELLVERSAASVRTRSRSALRRAKMGPAHGAHKLLMAVRAKRRTAAQARATGQVIGSHGRPVDPMRRRKGQMAARRGGAKRSKISRRRNMAAAQGQG